MKVIEKLKSIKWSFYYPINPILPSQLRKPKPEDAKGFHLPPGCRIPDWRDYKVTEYTPELQVLEQRLARHGLKDPWIRNEVWRHDARIMGSPFQRYGWIIRGIGTAVIVTALIVIYKSTIGKSGDDHHHHKEDKYLLSKELNAPRKQHHH